MKKLITLGVVSVLSVSAISQTITLNWQEKHGDAYIGTNNFDEGFAVAEDANGKYVGVGYRQSSPGGVVLNGASDYFYVYTNTDGTGDVETNSGSPGSDIAYSAIRTTDGNVLIGGTSNNTASIAKIDPTGALLFNKPFANSGVFYSVIEVSDGYVAAGYRDVGGNNQDYYLVKTDFSGNMVWEYTPSASGQQIAQSIVQTSNGEYIITGNENPNTIGSNYDGTYVRINSTGTGIVWQKKFGLSNNDYGYEILDISGATEAYAIAGGEDNLMVYKTIDGAGNVTGSVPYNLGNSIEIAYGMTKLANGNLVMVGEGSGNGKNALIVLVNQSGTKLADLTVDAFDSFNDNYLWDVKQASNGNIIVCGYWSESDANPEMYMAELSISGSSNQTPVANADTNTTPEDTPVTTNVAANDTDSDGSIVATSVTISVNPTNGTATVNANGEIVYTPNANFNGTDIITYQICDDGTPAACATGNLTITVTPVNDAPVANDDASTSTGAAVNINILTNDTDVDGTVAAATHTVDLDPATAGVQTTFSTTSPSASWSYAAGVLTCTPGAGASGAATITYELCDAGPLCDQATVTVDVTAGVNEKQLEIGVYPNPASDKVTILAGNEVAKTATIFAVDGKKVASVSVNGSVLELPAMNKGMYILEVEFVSGLTARKNILKN